jgi:hypothetical protein
LRGSGQLGHLLLGEPARLALRRDLLRDAREEPALVGVDVGEALAEAFEGTGRNGTTAAGEAAALTGKS